jgi:hypothetical protein
MYITLNLNGITDQGFEPSVPRRRNQLHYLENREQIRVWTLETKNEFQQWLWWKVPMKVAQENPWIYESMKYYEENGAVEQDVFVLDKEGLVKGHQFSVVDVCVLM